MGNHHHEIVDLSIRRWWFPISPDLESTHHPTSDPTGADGLCTPQMGSNTLGRLGNGWWYVQHPAKLGQNLVIFSADFATLRYSLATKIHLYQLIIWQLLHFGSKVSPIPLFIHLKYLIEITPITVLRARLRIFWKTLTFLFRDLDWVPQNETLLLHLKMNQNELGGSFDRPISFLFDKLVHCAILQLARWTFYELGVGRLLYKTIEHLAISGCTVTHKKWKSKVLYSIAVNRSWICSGVAKYVVSCGNGTLQ